MTTPSISYLAHARFRGPLRSSQLAVAKDAAAHHAAAQFLVAKGDIDPAIDQYHQGPSLRARTISACC